MFEPLRTAETAVREQPVVTEADPERAEHVKTDDGQHHAGPAEEPGHEGEQGEDVIADDPDRGRPVDATQVDLGRQRQAVRARRVRPDADRVDGQNRSPPSVAASMAGTWGHYPSCRPAMSTHGR